MMKSMRIVSIFLLLTCVQIVRGQTEPRPMKPLGVFALKTLDGDSIWSTNFTGKTRVFFLWMSADKPSQRQIPMLVDLQREFGASLAVIGISLEQDAEALKQSIATNTVNFPVFLADYDAIQNLGGVEAIPTLVVVEPHGIIVSRYVGYTEKAVIKNILQSIIDAPR